MLLHIGEWELCSVLYLFINGDHSIIQCKRKREIIENQQILDVLRGNMRVDDILSTNFAINNYVTKFKELNPRSNLDYQGVLGVSFRDFLISQPDLKSQINNCLKEQGLYGKGEIKHQIVYDFFDTFYNENNRGPNTLELYQTFLNFKSHELRGKINVIRKNYPQYYEED